MRGGYVHLPHRGYPYSESADISSLTAGIGSQWGCLEKRGEAVAPTAQLRGMAPLAVQRSMRLSAPTTFHWRHLWGVPLGEISTNRSISPCLLNSLITKSTCLTSIMAKEQLLRGVNSRRAGGQLQPLAVGKDRLCIAVFILPQRQGNNYHT